MKKLFISLCLLTVCYTFAQRGWRDQNFLGFTGGYAMADMLGDETKLKSKGGFFLGFETRGAFYNDWDLVYGIDIFQNKYEGEAQAFAGAVVQETEYTLIGGQIKFLASYRIISPNLAIDFGPALHFNGSLDLDDDGQENLFVTGADTTAGDLEDVGYVNLNLVGGITVGFRKVRLRAHYHYGVFPFWNTESVDGDDVKGNLGILYVGAIFYL